MEPALEGDAPSMRLRDIISGLQNQQVAAFELMGRIDPAITDELNAMVAHRRGGLADYVADILIQVALDAADAAWARAVEQRADTHADPEAAMIGHMVQKAMRQRLNDVLRIASNLPEAGKSSQARRVGHPYLAE